MYFNFIMVGMLALFTVIALFVMLFSPAGMIKKQLLVVFVLLIVFVSFMGLASNTYNVSGVVCDKRIGSSGENWIRITGEEKYYIVAERDFIRFAKGDFVEMKVVEIVGNPDPHVDSLRGINKSRSTACES